MSIPALSTRLLTLALALGVLSVSGCGGAQSRTAKHIAKGQAFLAKGNFEKARVEFQNALQISPKNAEVRLEMGIVDEKLGNMREAGSYYQGVIDVNPDNTEARTRLARLYMLSGVLDRALEVIQPGLEKHPDDARLLTVRAAIRNQQKDAAGALADAQRAVQLAPTDEDAIAVLAGVYKSRGEIDKAQSLLEQSVQMVPGSVDLRLILAQIYVQEKRPADAEAQLLKLVELKPGEISHRLRLAQFYAQSNQNDAAERTLRQAVKDLPAEREVKLSLIDFLAARRSRAIAEKELNAMIDVAPEDNELKFALARFYQEGKETAKAEAVYKAVIDKERLNPAGLTARDRLAAMRLLDNDVPGALVLVNEVLAKSPRDDDALMIRGSIALSQKDPRAAIADLRAVLRDQPNAVGVLRSLARAHLANGEPAIAEETMRHAVEANPTNPVLQLDFAQLLMQLNKPEQARTIIAALIKQKPDDIRALDTQFKIALTMGDLATARTAADAVAALRPKLAIGYMYQGMVAEADKRSDDALRLYTEAADLQPDGAEPLEAVVRILANSKRMPEAMKRLDEVAEKFPNNSHALVIKGELLLQTGKAAQAEETFKLAIARTPKWWRPYRGLARAQLETKEGADAAIATLRSAKAVAEQTEELSEQMASLLEKQGKPDDAIREYEDVLRRYPQSEVAANNLAMLLATYRNDPASLDRAKDLTARFANSPNPSYLDTYGWVLFKRGDAADSVPVLSRVVAKAPDAAVARYHLGMAQSLAGDDTGARDNLTRAVNSGTQFLGLSEAKATLDKLAKSPNSAASTPKT
ncbi:MAG: tetratricopeptide repeat protein [Steroidobacteraceae bacterium]